MKYTTIGSTFSGNKGAASMLEASIQTITEQDPSAEFTVMSIYPEEDKKFNKYRNVTILSTKPLFLGTVLNPLAFLYKVLPSLRPLLLKQRHIKALIDSEVILDQGGITFVDGRAKFLIYNVATILPAIFMGVRVIKCSQAMGPFNTRINSLTSKLILPYVHTICARGALTYKYLIAIGLKNVIESTDYAFLMDLNQDEIRKADAIVMKSGFRFQAKGKRIAIMPSEVVYKKAAVSGQNYVDYNVIFIKELLSKGFYVLLMAYSARGGRNSRHNNDLPICRDIAACIKDKNFTFIDDELSAQKLRYIIGKVDIAVTSRFHAMIAALTMTTPPIVVGWGHKYTEVMKMFGIENLTLDSQQLDQAALQSTFKALLDNQDKVKQEICNALPQVCKNAKKQVDQIRSL